MPIHDWSRVSDGTFHDFHTSWLPEIKKRLNQGVLPAGYFALAEQADFEKHISIRHATNDKVVALLEVLAPGTKAAQAHFDQFMTKAEQALRQDIHLLVIDLFRPTSRDPHGIHAAIWNYIDCGMFVPPVDKPLTLVSYCAGPVKEAFVDPVAVGDTLGDMPLFLTSDVYINVPFEQTYREAFEGVPGKYRAVLGQP